MYHYRRWIAYVALIYSFTSTMTQTTLSDMESIV